MKAVEILETSESKWNVVYAKCFCVNKRLIWLIYGSNFLSVTTSLSLGWNNLSLVYKFFFSIYLNRNEDIPPEHQYNREKVNSTRARVFKFVFEWNNFPDKCIQNLVYDIPKNIIGFTPSSSRDRVIIWFHMNT